MSTFTFPYWAEPVLDFYNLRWPDIDEDKVLELGHQIQELANAAWIFSIAVKGGLGELADSSDSQALTALQEDWGDYAAGPLQDITTGIGDGAVTTTLAISNGITAYKGGLLGVLTINVGSDIALICTGVGAAAVIAKKAVMREVLEIVLEQATREAAAWLVSQWNSEVESLILGPLEKLSREIGEDLGGSVRRIAAMSVPSNVIGGIAAPAAALYIDHHDIIDAVGRIATAYDRLETAAEKLASWSGGTGYTEPTPAPDHTLSTALKDAFDWASEAFLGQVKQIGRDILDRIIDVITDTYDKYVEADTELGQLARDLRERFSIPVVAQPYVIDRSMQPKPVMILDAPPPVITGQGISEARQLIATIDLTDAPEPVVTGAGESDARLSIRSIVLPDAPDPVQTGPGESDARDRIRPG